MNTYPTLPINEIFEPLKAYLSRSKTAIIIAPPGAGKTTGVPLALLKEAWVGDMSIIVLQPRRLAARAAAQRMAEVLGEEVGQTIGYRVRGESKISAKTRIEVVTEGIFTRKVLDDPSLEGVACVIFDEFHERSLDADLGLAFARDVQSLLREDLRLLVMSATLDGERVKSILNDAQIFHALGRSFEVRTHYLGRDQGMRIEDDIARHVARLSLKLEAQKSQTMLVFLPGQGEIHRVAQRLEPLGIADHIEVLKLYGAMDFKDQAYILNPKHTNTLTPKSRIVLTTSIAETSLTLDHVSMVVDCGQMRIGQFDVARGMTRLVTMRASKASVDQRRGRAGRSQVGDCYRLWDIENDRSLIAFTRPEILDTDLSQLVLNLRLWGVKTTDGLCLLDHPLKSSMAEAQSLLCALGAFDEHGDLSDEGRLMARLPMAPRLAHMLLQAANMGALEQGAWLCVLLGEPGIGGKSTDLDTRLQQFRHDKSQKATTSRQLAKSWSGLVSGLVKHDINQMDRPVNSSHLLALAYPERVAKARGKRGEFLMANGRGVYLDEFDAMARQPYLAIGDLGGGASRDKILLASPLEEADIIRFFAKRFKKTIKIEKLGKSMRAIEHTMFGDLIMSSKTLDKIPKEFALQAQAEEIRTKGLNALNLSSSFYMLRAQISFMRCDDQTYPDVSDEALLESLAEWLEPFAQGQSWLELSPQVTHQALLSKLDHDQQKKLKKHAPTTFCTPTGSHIPIDYTHEAGPYIEVRVQELFGLDVHPCVGLSAVPLIMSLLSPARKPVQITKDLPGFWRGSWGEVRRDMKGRYPRHPWPDDPISAQATTRAKPRGT